MSACPRCHTIACRCFSGPRAPTPKRCDTCTHWLKGSPIFNKDEQIGNHGWCHRRAPIVGFNRNGVALTKWPETDDADGCGEWQAPE